MKTTKPDDKIAEEIIKLKFKKSETLSGVLNRFYRIMRKHGIKEGTPCGGGGRIVARFEFTLYWTLFLETLSGQIDLGRFFGEFKVPKDLEK